MKRLLLLLCCLSSGCFAASDLVAWVSGNRWVYSPGTPFGAVNIGFVHITGGTGWTPGYYQVSNHVTAFATGTADGNQNMLFLSSAPAAAATRNGVGGYNDTCVQTNLGVAGQTTSDMNGDAVAQVDPLYSGTAPFALVFDGNSLTAGTGSTGLLDYPWQTLGNISTSLTHSYCIAWEGTNSIYFGASAATATSDIQTYCSGRISAGFRVIVLSVLPRSDGGTPGTFNTTRGTYNGTLRTDFSVATSNGRVFKPGGGVTYASAFVDVAANTLIGDNGDETDATYYSGDNVHLNNTGYTQIANDVYAAIVILETPPAAGNGAFFQLFGFTPAGDVWHRHYLPRVA